MKSRELRLSLFFGDWLRVNALVFDGIGLKIRVPKKKT